MQLVTPASLHVLSDAHFVVTELTFFSPTVEH